MDAAEGNELVEEGTYVPPEPTLTVAAVARRMGVAAPTLRTWDRRYGLGPSAHTAGAHRRYTSADVARLLLMRRLTLEGVSPADAAKIAKATAVSGDPIGPDGPATSEVPELTPVDGIATGAPADAAATPEAPFVDTSVWDAPRWDPEPAGDEADVFSDLDLDSARRADAEDPDDDFLGFDIPWRDEPDDEIESGFIDVLRDTGGARGSAGGGRVVALPTGTPASRGLARAAMSLDTYEIHRMLVESLRRDGTVETWEKMIMPVLRALGERTSSTGDGIDVEHAFSEVVLAAFRGVTFGPQRPRNSAPVLLACADGDYHSLPLHALGAALAERNIGVRMLGSGLPPHALSASVRRTGPSVIVLFARMPGADARPTESLRRQRPAPVILLAGPGWEPTSVPTFARQAGSLVQAIDEVLLGVHV